MRRARPDHETDGRRRQSQRDGDQRARSEADTTAREQPLAALHRAGGNQAVQSAVDNERVARSGAGSRVPDTTPETDRNTRKTDTQTTEGETETPGAQTPSRRESALERAIQPKLEVSNPTDRYEREADRVAAAVMRSENETQPRTADLEPALQRMCSRCRKRLQHGKPLDCEECEAQLQRAVDASGGHTIDDDSEVARQVRQARSGGRQLPAETRSFFESRMGQDFGDVRVHTDSQADRAARAVDARAFTLGSDVVFRSGEYRPNSRSGKRLLAHELTHVVQQGGADDAWTSRADDVSAERPTNRIQRIQRERLQRWEYGDTWAYDGVGPPPLGMERVPENERERVNEGMAIVERIVNNPNRYAACHDAFATHCTDSDHDTLPELVDKVKVWRDPGDGLGEHRPDSDHVAYSEKSYRIGRWTIAATIIHELAHMCGIGHGDDVDNEDAVAACGLPTVDDIPDSDSRTQDEQNDPQV